MSSEKADIQRLEALLMRVLEHSVRLECRLEEAGILKGPFYGDTTARYALEENIEYNHIGQKGPKMDSAFQTSVEDWLEAHENDEKPFFMTLEQHFGHEKRGELIALLRFFYMQDRWKSIIEGLENSGHPVKPGDLTKSPYPEA